MPQIYLIKCHKCIRYKLTQYIIYDILTGSNSIDKNGIMHTGTGRIDTLAMYPMSLYETGESNGSVSLIELFNNPEALDDGCESNLSINDLIFAACRGGWPSSLLKKSKKAKLLVAQSYFESLCREDMTNPSLVVAALGVDPDYFNLDLKTFGFIFETLCIRDLKVYSLSQNGRVSYYRDRYGLEADGVLHLRDGRYANRLPKRLRKKAIF